MEKKVMWQRCPKCKTWCKAEKKGFFGRIGRLFSKEDDDISEDMANVFDILGQKGLGRGLGKGLNNRGGILTAPGEAIGGDNYKFYCPECENSWGTDDENTDETEGYELSKEANDLYAEYNTIGSMSSEDIEHYVNRIMTSQNQMQDVPGIDDYQSSLCDLLASVQYFHLHNSTKALVAINKSISLWPGDANAKALRGVFRTDIQKPIDRYHKLQDIIHYKDAERESLFLSSSEFQTELNNEAERYANAFLQIPKEQRKFLVVDDELRCLPNSFLVISADMLPALDASGLVFSNGYASEKTLYICHPYKTNVYLDADNYKDELFCDQMHDLLEVLQCLGAKQIDIKDLRSNETTSQSATDYRAKLGGEYKGVGENTEGTYEKAAECYEKTKKEFFHQHKFTLNEDVPPFVYEDSVWFKHLSNWQTMARMRLRGEEHYKIFLSSMKESLIKGNEQLQLKADFDALIAKGNLEGAHSLSFEQQEKVNHEWEIEVEFYPLNCYKRKDAAIASATQPLSTNGTNVPKRKK